MITLKQAIDIMNQIKSNHPEIEIIVENGHFVLKEKLIKLNNNCYIKEV